MILSRTKPVQLTYHVGEGKMADNSKTVVTWTAGKMAVSRLNKWDDCTLWDDRIMCDHLGADNCITSEQVRWLYHVGKGKTTVSRGDR